MAGRAVAGRAVAGRAVAGQEAAGQEAAGLETAGQVVENVNQLTLTKSAGRPLAKVR
ncbi:hypothetical protein GCM10010486_41950 [Nonomuraea roseoviolacea subsp. carminata]